MVKAYRVSLTLAIAAGLASPAFAGDPAPAQAPATPTAAAPNANEIICEKQQSTGSRLVTKKVCMTRAEWADKRLQDRQEVERVQISRGAKGE